MELPGDTGWGLLGDKTIEFARLPHQFVQDRITKYGSKVFLSRLINKPTVFVASNRGVKEMLYDKSLSFEMGYKDFGYMHDLYGDLFMFEDGEAAYRIRRVIKELFLPENCDYYMTAVERVTKEKLQALDTREPFDIYELLKDLATNIFLDLFVGVEGKEDYDVIKQLATTHWHGLLSFPLSIKVKGWSSGYHKAEEAKSQLLKIIHRKLGSGNDKGRFMQIISEAGFKDQDEAAIHVLLFISAVIPKALSSLLTSFVYEVAGKEKKEVRSRLLKDDQFQGDVLLEIQRLWPPFFGGRRYANENVVIDGYQIPAGYCVAYISKFANRDESVFDQKDIFLPERWQKCDKDKRHLVSTFGGGSRCCVGISLVNHIYKLITTYLASNYDWEIKGNSGPVFKVLPVMRPKEPLLTTFSRIIIKNVLE